MRKCKKCGHTKELIEFRKRQIYFTHTCKECLNAPARTGKINTGRFVKGIVPWIKGKKGVKKRDLPKYIKKSPGINHSSGLRIEWAVEVKKRDGLMCRICESKEKLHAHHIVPWKKDESKRFDLENGVTLCHSCHMKVERYIDFCQGKNNFKGHK